MEWSTPDLNPFKILGSSVKRKLYEGDKQYNSKADLYKAIQFKMSETEPAEVKEMTIINV